MDEKFRQELSVIKTELEKINEKMTEIASTQYEWLSSHKDGWEETSKGERAWDEYFAAEKIQNNIENGIGVINMIITNQFAGL